MHLFAFFVVARLLGDISSGPGLTHLLLYAALWGYAASWVNQFIKQDGWPTVVNTVIANLVVVVSAVVATLVNSPEQALTLHAFWVALFAAFSAAVINHQFFLEPTGIGAHLKARTSIVRRKPAKKSVAAR
jgi:FtsH-binding integral membrane protein